MADFEALIRDALSKQDASNSEVRKKVYQSSRNALERMISRAENATPEAAARQRQSLEESIRRIEADHGGANRGDTQAGAPRKLVDPIARPTAVRNARQEPVAPRAAVSHSPEMRAPEPKIEAPAQPPKASTPPSPAPVAPVNPPQKASVAAPRDHDPSMRREPELEPSAPEMAHDMGIDGVELVDHTDYDRYADNDFTAPPPELRRKRGWPLRWLVTLIFMALFFVLGYYMYTVVIQYVADYNANPPKKEELAGEQNKGVKYIDILRPQDSSGLIVADRGTAEIIDLGGDKKVIRIQSVRQNGNKNELAKPVLIELKPGVMKDIAGKAVTFEIQAKSGGSEQAQFSVECQFGGSEEGDCDRKRFRVGPQPVAVVFNVDIAQNASEQKSAYLAINTDITKSANVSGQGELLDIYDVRIRMAEE